MSKTIPVIGVGIGAGIALLWTGCSDFGCEARGERGREDQRSQTGGVCSAGRRGAAGAGIQLKDADGQTVHPADYKGKVVLLDFWATWCGPCKIEIPWFMDFERQFKDQGFAVVGVSMDEDGWTVDQALCPEHEDELSRPAGQR